MQQVIIGQVLSGIAGGVSGIMYAIASEVLPSNYRAYSQAVVNMYVRHIHHWYYSKSY